ncbi:MAG TPA: hypothetical protein GX715_03555 [Armatimonadetes bacterium]|jgi:hypothetical protein|nr:hypothetical protein [Armatimonadota bacterium]
MTLRDAMQGLGENPLYWLERRRQWRGMRSSLLVLGLLCCACGHSLAFVLAPAFAAMAILHDKRTRLWDDLLLTRLTSEEIVLAMVAAALQIPAMLLSVQAALVLIALVGGICHTEPAGTPWLECLRGLVVMLPTLVTGIVAAASFLVVGGLIGIRAGLHFRDTFGGVAGALLGTLAVGALVVAAGVLTTPRMIHPGEALSRVLSPLGSAGLWAAMSLETALLALLNALLASLLWRACVRAVRPAGS